jgi:hypothetical protein
MSNLTVKLNKEETEAYLAARIPKGEPVGQCPTTRTFKVNHVDTCCTDYFGGHHLPNFAIQVTGNTTYKELLGMCLEWQNTDHLDEELFRNSEDYNAFRDAIIEMFSMVDDMDAVFQPSLEVPETEEEQEYWDVCAFFSVEILGEDIQEQCRDYMRQLYRELEEAHTYSTSLDAFIEQVEFQDFNENGDLA